MKKLKRVTVAVIGATVMGPARARAIKNNPNAEMVYICARTKEKAQPLAAKLGCRWEDNWQKTISAKDVQAVIIASGNPAHEEMVRFALEKGKHVMVEYPTATNRGAAEKLYKLALTKGLVLYPVADNRASASFRLMQKYLPSIGAPLWYQSRYVLGERWTPSWLYDDKLSGGFAIACLLYDIDTVLRLLGSPEWVNAHGGERQKQGGRVTKWQSVQLGYENGAVATITMASPVVAGAGERSESLVGERGLILADKSNLTLAVGGRVKTFNLSDTDPTHVTTDEFITEVIEQKNNMERLEQSLLTERVCFAALESLQKGRRIQKKW